MSTSLDTKNKITKVFAQLAMAHEIEKINIKEITKCCGCNRQTFYYHFSSKQDLLLRLFKTETFGCLFKNDVIKDNWIAIISEFLLDISIQRELYYNILHYDSHLFQTCFHNEFNLFFIELFSEARLANKVEISYAEFLSYGFCGIVMDWILTKCREELESIILNVVHLVKSIEKIVGSI